MLEYAPLSPLPSAQETSVYRRTTASLLAAGAALGLSGCTVPDESAFALSPWAVVERCDTPSQSDITAVHSLLTTPQHLKPVEKKDFGTVASPAAPRYEELVAQQLGLHLADTSKIDFKKIDEEGLRIEPVTVDEYLQVLGDFTKPYGVETVAEKSQLDAETQKYFKPIDFSAMTGDEIRYFKSNLKILMYGMRSLPVELVKQTGLKKIVLMDRSNTAAVGAAEVGRGEMIFMDPRLNIQRTVFMHELTHVWDRKQCKNPNLMSDDPDFVALNPAGRATYVGDLYPVPEAWPTYDSNEEYVAQSPEVTDLLIRTTEAYALPAAKRKAAHAAIDAEYDKLYKNVLVKNPYGFKDAGEDKALIGEDIFSPYTYKATIMQNWHNAYQQKAEYLLARIYQDDPRIVRYFISLATRYDD